MQINSPKKCRRKKLCRRATPLVSSKCLPSSLIDPLQVFSSSGLTSSYPINGRFFRDLFILLFLLLPATPALLPRKRNLFTSRSEGGGGGVSLVVLHHLILLKKVFWEGRRCANGGG